jgi:hypothetical protein
MGAYNLLNPHLLLEEWQGLIEIVREGYPNSCYELDYDLIVRDKIEELLEDKDFRQDSSFHFFQVKVFAVDREFKILSEEPKANNLLPWWRRRILKFGKEDYAKSIKVEFNYDVRVVN